ncbi:nucleotidyltransferase family protein [Roseiarcus sp.]|uniref:nucleotidyltransferase family protein n=1 Tax=Roseiarcus sp. TaxID=1969460 RepID=UPI003D0E9B57
MLRGGIIAAGHGTRLRADGHHASKPMAPVGGRPLIEHTLDRFRAAGIRRVTVIINEGSDDCRRWLGGHGQDFDLDVIVRTPAGRRFPPFCVGGGGLSERRGRPRPDRPCR